MDLDRGVEIVVDVACLGFKVGNGYGKKTKSELRANLLKLSEACPFHTANPEDCPLFLLRKMTPRKRLSYVNALSKSDLAYLATYHRVCLTIKVESGLANLRIRTLAKGRKRTRGRSGR
jgi:hypothetical protein